MHFAVTMAKAGGAGGSDAAFLQSLTLDHVSPATRLLEKRRQMFEVQEALDAQKEEFARREVGLAALAPWCITFLRVFVLFGALIFVCVFVCVCVCV